MNELAVPPGVFADIESLSTVIKIIMLNEKSLRKEPHGV